MKKPVRNLAKEHDLVAPPGAGPVLLSSKDVMRRLGFKHRAAFWSFVAAKSVPVVRLNARNIKFDPRQLEEWLASRSTKAA